MARGPQPTPPQRAFGTKYWSAFTFAGMNLQSSAIAMDDKEFKWIENFVRLGDGNFRALHDVGNIQYESPNWPQVTIVSHFPFSIGTRYFNAIFLSDGSAVQEDIITGVTIPMGPPGTFYKPGPGSSLPACVQWGVLYLLISNRNTQNDYWAWDGSILYTAGTAAPNGVLLLATGSDYVNAPTAVAQDGSGSGMVLKAVINAGGVVNVEITNPGHGYEPGDQVQVAFSGGGSDNSAILEATLVAGGVTAVNVTASGSGYTSPVVAFTGGGGSGATGTAVVGDGIASVGVTTTGANYTSATVSFTGGGGSGAIATASIVGGQITAINLIAPGSGYTTAPTVVIVGDGTGATATAVIQNDGIISVTMTNPGSGYTSAPTVTSTDGGPGTGATAVAVLSSTHVSGVTVVNGGTGFFYNPNIIFVGGGGTGASGTTLLTPTSIARIDVTSGGSNYQNAPTVVFSGGSQFGAGTPPKAHALLANGSVSSVVIDSPGSGFETIPEVIFTNAKNDTTGAGAGAVVRLQPTSIASVEMSNYGVGYTSAPSVQVQSGANNAAYAIIIMMPFGISGNSIETFQSRVWIDNPAPSPYDTIPPGGDFAVSAPGSISDFATSDGGVLFTNSDGFLQTQYKGVKQSSGYLYQFGDGSISIISAVQTAGNPATTSFSYQNVDPQSGLAWRDTAQDFSKTILFANETGVYGLYGGVATKVSQKLDQLFTNAVFPSIFGEAFPPGGITPCSAVATIYNIKHYLMLMTVIDPDTEAQRNVMIAWNEREWTIASQSVDLIYLATQKVDSRFIAWGTDGRFLYRLFQKPSSELVKRLDTKLYGAPQFDMIKDLNNLTVVAGDYSGQGIEFTPSFDTAGGVLPQPEDPAYQSVAGGVYTPLIQNEIAFPPSTTGNLGTYATGTGGLSGVFVGLRLTTTSPDFVVASLMLTYSEKTPLQ